jgi:hypothetical protein
MVGGDTAAQWATREQAVALLNRASVVSRVDQYRSECLIIVRCQTLTAGTYFVVTEADVLFPEDIDALEVLGAEVGEPWRMKVLETDVYGTPHPHLPMSSTFRVHVVHPSVPEGTPRRRIALAG